MVPQTVASNRRVVSQTWIGNDVEWSCLGHIYTFLVFTWNRWRTRMTLFRIVNVLAGVWNEHLLRTSQKCYHLSQLVFVPEPWHLFNCFSVDEVEAAHSLAFSPCGEKLYCGFKNVIRIFNTNLPGRHCETRNLKRE
jgi:hypothetical protein